MTISHKELRSIIKEELSIISESGNPWESLGPEDAGTPMAKLADQWTKAQGALRELSKMRNVSGLERFHADMPGKFDDVDRALELLDVSMSRAGSDPSFLDRIKDMVPE
jgi:hypothetical protein